MAKKKKKSLSADVEVPRGGVEQVEIEEVETAQAAPAHVEPGRAVSRQGEAEQIDPDELMGDINKLSFFGTTLVSLLIHAVLIGGTSVGFIMLCAEYNTLDPKTEIRAEAEKRRVEERKQKLADQRAKYAADKKATTPKGGEPQGGGNTGGQGDKPAGGSGRTGTTGGSGDITRKATTLPSGTGVGLDDIGEYE